MNHDIEYRLTLWFYWYQNTPYIFNKNSSILYINFYNGDLKIELSASFFIIFFNGYFLLEKTNLYSVLLFFVDFF